MKNSLASTVHRWLASPAAGSGWPTEGNPLKKPRSAALATHVATALLGLALVFGLHPLNAAPVGLADDQVEAKKVKPAEVVEDRSSRETARSKGELTFDDLKFDIERDGVFKRSMLTKEIEELHKKDVRIRGYILPASVFKQTGIQEFVLVRDNMECCFGPGAMIYDCIIVQMEKGQQADFTVRPVAVKGRLEIQEFKYPDSEEHYAIYRIVGTEVK